MTFFFQNIFIMNRGAWRLRDGFQSIEEAAFLVGYIIIPFGISALITYFIFRKVNFKLKSKSSTIFKSLVMSLFCSIITCSIFSAYFVLSRDGITYSDHENSFLDMLYYFITTFGIGLFFSLLAVLVTAFTYSYLVINKQKALAFC